MPLTLSPHVMQTEPGTRRDRIVKVVPYICLNRDQGPPVFLQKGKIFSENGKEIKKEDYPNWFYEELDKLTPDALEEVGWANKVKRVKQEVQLQPKVVKKKVRRKRRKKVIPKIEAESPNMGESDGNSLPGGNVDL